MSEEEIIKILKEIDIVDFYNTYTDSTTDFSEPRKYCDAIQGLLDLYNNEKDKNIELYKEIDKLQEKNQVLKVMSQNNFTNAFMESNYISKDKINSKIEEYEEILDSPIIKEDYKLEVQHIIGVLKELKGDN